MPVAIAHAKLNLALHITGTRPDGCHLLSSIVAFADYGDGVEVSPATESGCAERRATGRKDYTLSLEISGAFAHQLTGRIEDNLIWRAATLLRGISPSQKGAAIRLQKNLPVASGMGGGSSDAATAALLLNALWQLGLSREQLADILLPLGADIPVCLQGMPVLVEGIGEQMTKLADLPTFGVVLVNPGVAVATPEVFARYDRGQPPPDTPILQPVTKCLPSYHPLPLAQRASFPLPSRERVRVRGLTPPSFIANFSLQTILQEEWLALLRQCHNALQEPACMLAPVIREVVRELEKNVECLLARMSGSGATCFGLYATAERAASAAALLSARHPHWWVQYSRISGQ